MIFKNLLFITFILHPLCSFAQILSDLKNPPVACVEEAVPSFPNDYLVSEPFGFHPEIQEVLDRTRGNLYIGFPHLEDDWRLLNSASHAKSKIETIYQTANRYDMPAQILTGALLQESSMADFGINEDFGNWSCGIGQLNILEWCDWAIHQDPSTQDEIQWPRKEANRVIRENPGLDVCSGYFLRASFAKPFYTIGMKRLRADGIQRPDFLLSNETFMNPKRIENYQVWDGINIESLKKTHCTRKNRYNSECLKISKTDNETHAASLRFLITQNFTEHCADYHYGIPAKGHTLRAIFDTLPKEIKESQHYEENESYSRNCYQNQKSKVYPLQLGWLLADIVYNAGDEILPGIMNYQKKNHLDWNTMEPNQLVQAVHETLKIKKYNRHLTPIGRCEARFHIQNVIKNVTLPDAKIVDSTPEDNQSCDQDGNLKSTPPDVLPTNNE